MVAELTNNAEHSATSSSAGQPAARTVVRKRAAETLVLKEATPLYDAFLRLIGDERGGSDVMNYIGHKCFYDKLLLINEYGDELENAMSLSSKMEKLLSVCKRERQRYIA